MNFFSKILTGEQRRLLILKVAAVMFYVISMSIIFLGRYDIAFGLVGAAYAVLGYRKYKKYSAAKGVSQ